ncbi:MAG: zinc-ribbon domain containing protein [Patescibacteria group bacterium]
MDAQIKNCQNCEKEFIITQDDQQFYAKVQVPTPTFCPDCRLKRRLVWRNERTLYRNNCDLCKKSIVSIYHKDSTYTVYCQKCWWGDGWDGLEYARDIDWEKPFFEQLNSLINDIPKLGLPSDYPSLINSEYSNWCGDLKNCFLITDADYVEDSAYGSGLFQVKDCFDCGNITESELCYESFNLRKCYKTFYSVDCRDCIDVLFSKNCSNCTNCFGCVNLKNKSYNIFNKQYSKEEYFDKINELFGGSYNKLKEIQSKMKNLWLEYPQKYFRGHSNVNSSGDYIYNSKNAKNTFLASNVEDSKFISLLHSKSTKDCYDYTDWGDTAQRLYECMSVGLGADSIKFSHMIIKSVREVEYSYYCVTSSNLFGCASLRNKQYCILNKQYTKEEYEELAPKIRRHMGGD